MASRYVYGLCVFVNVLWYFGGGVSGGKVHEFLSGRQETSGCDIEKFELKHGTSKYTLHRYTCEKVIKERCEYIYPNMGFSYHFEVYSGENLLFATCSKEENGAKDFRFKCKSGGLHVFDMYMTSKKSPAYQQCHRCSFTERSGDIGIKKCAATSCTSVDASRTLQKCAGQTGADVMGESETAVWDPVTK